MIVYERKNFIVKKTNDGFIIINTKKPFKSGHTHISNYNTCKIIIDNVIRKSVPNIKDTYLLISHVRLSTDEAYIKLLMDIHDVLLEDMHKPYMKRKRRVNHKI